MALFETIVRSKGVPMPSLQGVPSVWERTEVESANGVLYSSPGCPSKIAQRVLRLATTGPALWQRPVSRGEAGHIYKLGGIVFKLFHQSNAPREDYLYGLSAIRANVALNVGMQDGVPFSEPTPDGSQAMTYTLRAPEIFAAFSPNSFTQRGARPVWAMEYIPGVNATEADLPSDALRRVQYGDAVSRCDIEPWKLQFENDIGNVMVTGRSKNQIDLVKIDAMAAGTI